MPVVDELSRFVTVFFLKQKSEAANLPLQCIRFHENFIGNRVSSEFNSQYLRDELNKKGIRLQTTIPYSPQQNGIAERMNRTLNDRVRTMLIQSGLSQRYWQFAVATAAHVTNRVPSTANNGIAPYQL